MSRCDELAKQATRLCSAEMYDWGSGLTDAEKVVYGIASRSAEWEFTALFREGS